MTHNQQSTELQTNEGRSRTRKSLPLQLKNLIHLQTKNVVLNIAGSAILAFGLYNIHSLSGVTEGGILGMTLLLQHWLHLSPAVSGFIMNAVCYLIGWRLLGHSFIAYSIIAGGSFSLFYAICELFPPVMPWIAEMPLLAAVLGALFVGVGAGLCVRAGGAPSGDDALAMSICQKFRWDIRWAYLLSDLIVLGLSLTYLDIGRIGLSLLTVVLSGQIIGIIQKIGQKKEADSPEEEQPASDIEPMEMITEEDISAAEAPAEDPLVASTWAEQERIAPEAAASQDEQILDQEQGEILAAEAAMAEDLSLAELPLSDSVVAEMSSSDQDPNTEKRE